jgi:hypothetical protein
MDHKSSYTAQRACASIEARLTIELIDGYLKGMKQWTGKERFQIGDPLLKSAENTVAIMKVTLIQP